MHPTVASPTLKRETRSSRAKTQQEQQQKQEQHAAVADLRCNRPKPARPSESDTSWRAFAPWEGDAMEGKSKMACAASGREREISEANKGVSTSGFNGTQGLMLCASTRCVLLDRNLQGITPAQHLRLLNATSTVTARTLKNVIAGRLLAPVSDRCTPFSLSFCCCIHRADLVREYIFEDSPDICLPWLVSKEQLLSQYVSAIHGVSPAEDADMDLDPPAPVASRMLAGEQMVVVPSDASCVEEFLGAPLLASNPLWWEAISTTLRPFK
jgi:hypothetical protein